MKVELANVFRSIASPYKVEEIIRNRKQTLLEITLRL